MGTLGGGVGGMGGGGRGERGVFGSLGKSTSNEPEHNITLNNAIFPL